MNKNRGEESSRKKPAKLRGGHINSVKVGDFEITSSNEPLSKVVGNMKELIKDYNDYSNLKTMDKIRRGIGGLG